MSFPDHWCDPRRNAVRCDDAAADFVAALAASRAPRVRLAYALARIDRARHYRYEGAATLEEYAERYGLEGAEARVLAQAGHAMRLVDGLEEAVLAGEVSFRSARELWLTCRPRDDEPVDRRRPLDRWLELAKVTSTRPFARLARYVRAAERLGEPPSRLEFLVSSRLLDRWRRLRVVAQHREKRPLCEEEILELAIDHYLQSYDVWARKGGKRRLPDTRDRDGRYIAVEVRRYVWERDGGRCVFPGCEWEGEIHFGHVVAHADGGHREGDNICCECPLHNEMDRAGDVRVIGPAHAPGFEWKALGGEGWDGIDRPYWMEEASRKERADLAAHRHLGEPLPRTDPAGDGLTELDLVVPPCADPTPDDPRWLTDRRVRVPYLDALDTSKLDAWLDAFFTCPSSSAPPSCPPRARHPPIPPPSPADRNGRRCAPGRPGGT